MHHHFFLPGFLRDVGFVCLPQVNGKVTSPRWTCHALAVESHNTLPRTIEVGFKLYGTSDAGVRHSSLCIYGCSVCMPPLHCSVVGVEISADRHLHIVAHARVIVADPLQAVADPLDPQFHGIGPRQGALREQDPALPHTGHRLCLQGCTGQEQEQSGYERRPQSGIDHHVK